MPKASTATVALGVLLRAQRVTDAWKLPFLVPSSIPGRFVLRPSPCPRGRARSFLQLLLLLLSVNVFIDGALLDRTGSLCGSLHGRVGQVWMPQCAFGVGQCELCPGPLWAVKWAQANQARRLKTDPQSRDRSPLRMKFGAQGLMQLSSC